MIRLIIRAITLLVTSPILLLVLGFTNTESGQQTVLMAEMPLYLEEHLDAAHIEGSKVPEDVLKPVEWRFDEPQPDWKPLKPIPAQMEAVKPVRVEDALRLSLTAKNRPINVPRLFGVIYVELPDWNIEDWEYVEIRARTRDPMPIVRLHFNYTEENPDTTLFPTYSRSAVSRSLAEGTVQRYRFSLDRRTRDWQGPWTHLMIGCVSDKDAEAATFDILSVRVIPKVAPYADAPVGVQDEVRNKEQRCTIFTHAPGKLQYRLHMPQTGRLDVGLGVLREDIPVIFRVTAKPDGGNNVTILEETYSDDKNWAQRYVDLSDFSRKKITLSLEADAKRAGTLAFWAEPTVSGRRRTERLHIYTLIWDTQSPFVNEVNLRNRTNWQVVVSSEISTWPDPRGREYLFKGDPVVENDHLVAVFRSEIGRVVVYSKANLSEKKVEFVPLQFKEGPANITKCRILQNTGDDAALEVSFAGAETDEELSAIFSFSKREIVEIKPAENMKGVSLFSPIEYGIVPDCIADDLIFSPKKHPSINTLHIPSNNLFLGLLKGQNSMLVVTWHQGRQQMKLMLADQQEEPRLIESIDFNSDGKSIYLALLDAPGIWHKEELKSSYLEKDITIHWKRPFPAKWITQLPEAGIRTTYKFIGSKVGIGGREEIGWYIYPVWFEGENTVYRLGKKIPPKGESLIYFLERKATPTSVSVPVDIMKEALGSQACETILDIPGRVLRTHHRRPGITRASASTCAFTSSVLEPIFKKNQEVQKRELVEETVDDMVFFVTRLRERINEYQDFANDMIFFLKLQQKSFPDLRSFLDSMERITQEIIHDYGRTEEHIKTLDYVNELAQTTKTLARKKAPDNLSTMLDLGNKWRGIGQAQDDLLQRFHRVTRKLFQEAGYGCVNQSQAVEIAEEIRRRCRRCLRKPYGCEIWADY